MPIVPDAINFSKVPFTYFPVPAPTTDPPEPKMILKDAVVLNLPFMNVIIPFALMFAVNVTFAVLSIVRLCIVVLLSPGTCSIAPLNL